jgi:hypothetical protein
MLQLSASSSSASVAPGGAKPMSCPMCHDASANVADVTSSGAGARALVAHGVPTKAVKSHLCPECVTTITVANLGKQSPPDAVAHQCASCNSEAPAADTMEQMPGMAH